MSELEIKGARRLDILAHICRRKGWALLLRTDGLPTISSRASSAGECSHLSSLDVVELASTGYDYTRKARITAGDLLARGIVTDPADLARAAADCLDVLGACGLLDEAA